MDMVRVVARDRGSNPVGSYVFLFADFEQRTLILISTDFRSYILMKAVTAPHRTTAPVPGHFGPKPFRHGTPQDRPKLIFLWGSAELHSPAIILTLALASKLKELSASTITKITVREYCTLKDCEGVSKFKGMPGSVPIKQTAIMYNKQKYCQGV